MNIKILGMKCRVELLIIAVILGFLMNAMVFCTCLKQEGMSNLTDKMSAGVHNDSYEAIPDKSESYRGPKVPLPEGQLFMYADNEFKPECCKFSSVSGSNGCACETREQKDYLNLRGGNRSALEMGEF